MVNIPYMDDLGSVGENHEQYIQWFIYYSKDSVRIHVAKVNFAKFTDWSDQNWREGERNGGWSLLIETKNRDWSLKCWFKRSENKERSNKKSIKLSNNHW